MERYRQRVTNSILESIKEEKATNKTEQLQQLGYLMNFYKIMENYDNVIKTLQRQKEGQSSSNKAKFQPSKYEQRLFNSIIEAIEDTKPEEGNKSEIIEQADYMKNLNTMMLDFPNVIQILAKQEKQDMGGDIEI